MLVCKRQGGRHTSAGALPSRAPAGSWLPNRTRRDSGEVAAAAGSSTTSSPMCDGGRSEEGYSAVAIEAPIPSMGEKAGGVPATGDAHPVMYFYYYLYFHIIKYLYFHLVACGTSPLDGQGYRRLLSEDATNAPHDTALNHPAKNSEIKTLMNRCSRPPFFAKPRLVCKSGAHPMANHFCKRM